MSLAKYTFLIRLYLLIDLLIWIAISAVYQAQSLFVALPKNQLLLCMIEFEQKRA